MIARLLIITQIYSNLFQGIVHAATLVDESHYHRHLLEKPDDRGDDESIPPTASSGVEDAHISSFTHLYSEINQRGELQFALGDGSFKAPRVFTIPTPDNPADILEYGGVTVKAQSTSFRFQGLRVSINRAGVMVVEGCQTAHHNPIFLASNCPIILSNIEASGLSIAAPRIVHSGISTIEQLKFEGMGAAEGDASFINAGQISAKELFLTHLNSVNGGGISATRFAVDGKLSSTGSINSSELILEENALLRLTDTSRADIKTLFLSQASHLENHATTHTSSIGVLDGLGGSLTNHGTLAVSEVAADSAFQAITNRHILDVECGNIKTQSLENSGTFMAAESRLQVTSGKNQQALKAKQLVVEAEFANEESGHLAVEVIVGDGYFHNLGKIKTEETLGLAIKRFSNSGLVKAQSVIEWIPDMLSDASLSGLEQLDNSKDGVIEATRGISFTKHTQVNNFGKLQTEDIALYSDKTLQKGDLIARTLNLIGGTFLNQGEIEVDHLTAENGLINQASLITGKSTDFGAGGFTNAARAKAQLKGLVLSDDTRVINHGKLAIEGIYTAFGILQLTNTGTGTATIDAGHALPSSSVVISAPRSVIDLSLAETTAYITDSEFAGKSAHQLKEIAVKYKQELGFEDAVITDPEFPGKSPYQLKEIAVKYKNLIHETQLTVDPEFRTLAQARSTGGKYKSEVLSQDPIQSDPEFYTLSQAREAGARYKAQAKLALETKLAQLQQQRSEFHRLFPSPYDAQFKDMNGLIVKQLASRYKRQALGIPENSQIDPEFSPMSGLILKQVSSKYKFYKEHPQSYVVDQEFQKVQKELADTRWNFGLTLQERQFRDAQLAADRAKLATENFKVRLSVVNQSTGKLTLRSGHFDLTTDQALVNDGVLYQEAAQLEWTDPTTWSNPRSFNAGTWRVKGTLTLLGNGAKDVGKLEVEDGLHVHTAEIGSRVLRGQIETADFSAGSGIDLFGSLTTHRSTQLQGLTIAADAVANLKSLKLTGGEISNLGKLRIVGVDPASGVIKLTNGGIAMIDDQQTLPRLDERSPENLARVATRNGPASWYSQSNLEVDHEFAHPYISPSTVKSGGSRYLGLLRALTKKEPYVYDYQTDPTLASANGLHLKQLATGHKKAFIKLYESEVAKSQTEGSPAEQAELQQYLKQFEPAYQQILASRVAYAKSSHPALGAALVVENAQIPAVKLQLLNQTPGQLTLKSGKFEFVGDAALVNDGTLTQHSAYTLWLTSTPGVFSRGSWRSAGSLGLLGYIDARFAELQVGGTLYVDSTNDAFRVLEGLANAQAATVSIKASVASGLNPELAELYPMLSQKAYETQHFKRDVLPKLYTKFSYPNYESYEKYILSFNLGYHTNIAVRDAIEQSGKVFETFMHQGIRVGQGIPFTMYSETERRARLTELAEKYKITCPWPLEILISGNDFTNGFNLSAPSLKIQSRIFKTSGNIASQTPLEITAAETAEVSALIGGREGLNLQAKKLTVLGKAPIAGATSPAILHKRSGNGLYSSEGPVV